MKPKKELKPEQFGMYNRMFARKYGLDAAILIYQLMYKQDYFEKNKMMGSDGTFYNSHIDLQRDTSLSPYRQREATKTLVALKVIEHSETYWDDNRTISVWKVDVEKFLAIMEILTKEEQDTIKNLTDTSENFDGHHQKTTRTPIKNLTDTVKKPHTTKNKTENKTENYTKKKTENKLKDAEGEAPSPKEGAQKKGNGLSPISDDSHQETLKNAGEDGTIQDAFKVVTQKEVTPSLRSVGAAEPAPKQSDVKGMTEEEIAETRKNIRTKNEHKSEVKEPVKEVEHTAEEQLNGSDEPMDETLELLWKQAQTLQNELKKTPPIPGNEQRKELRDAWTNELETIQKQISELNGGDDR